MMMKGPEMDTDPQGSDESSNAEVSSYGRIY
jgi:hypothetical protein